MSGNKRIVKNSIILYVRLIISSFLGLFTARIVLQELGASDFGLYAVVGGIVALLNFFSTSMIATTFRFIAVEIGKGDKGNANKIFNTSLTIHLFLAFIILIFAEIAGSFYVTNYLNVDKSKITDALFVLHFSILATFFTVISIPFQALITATEDFFTSALINLIQAVLRLGAALALMFFVTDKLATYAILTAIVIFFSTVQFYIHCYRKYFTIIKWNFNKNFSDYHSLISYNLWILVGTIAHIGRSQGSVLILNAFFGTIVNAAYGVANQLNGFIMYFTKNLNQATVPQITKSYSAGQQGRSMSLVYSITKYSFFLMLLPTVPLIFSMDEILKLWLKDVPVWTNEFVIVMLVNGLLGCLSSGFDAAIQATGKIKNYQLSYSVILLSSLTVAYFLFSLGFKPYFINITFLISSFIMIIIGIRYMIKLTDFSLKYYATKTLFRVLLVVSLLIPLYFLRMIITESFMGLIVFSIFSVVFTLTIIFLVGLEISEKIVLKNYAIEAYTRLMKR